MAPFHPLREDARAFTARAGAALAVFVTIAVVLLAGGGDQPLATAEANKGDTGAGDAAVVGQTTSAPADVPATEPVLGEAPPEAPPVQAAPAEVPPAQAQPAEAQPAEAAPLEAPPAEAPPAAKPPAVSNSAAGGQPPAESRALGGGDADSKRSIPDKDDGGGSGGGKDGGDDDDDGWHGGGGGGGGNGGGKDGDDDGWHGGGGGGGVGHGDDDDDDGWHGGGGGRDDDDDDGWHGGGGDDDGKPGGGNSPPSGGGKGEDDNNGGDDEPAPSGRPQVTPPPTPAQLSGGDSGGSGGSSPGTPATAPEPGDGTFVLADTGGRGGEQPSETSNQNIQATGGGTAAGQDITGTGGVPAGDTGDTGSDSAPGGTGGAATSGSAGGSGAGGDDAGGADGAGGSGGGDGESDGDQGSDQNADEGLGPLPPAVTEFVTELDVPESLKAALAALAALSVLLGVGYLLSALRARRLARQRRELLQEVGLLQTALLPPVPDKVGALLTSVAYRPADGPGAGGDFYDVIPLAGGSVGFILGDVSGHGRGALARTAFMRYTLRAYLEAGLEPRVALQVAGRVIDENLGGDFATVLLAVHDPETGSLTYATAGHPSPIVVGPETHVPVTAGSSPPIGVGVRTGLRQTTVPLVSGSVAALFTDGLLEARTENGILGRERLEELLTEIEDDPSAHRLIDRVANESTLLSDDMAAVVVTPTAGVTAGLFRTEQLELSASELDGPIARRFLEATGLPEAEVAEAEREARELAGRFGGVVLHVVYGNRLSVDVLPRNVESIEAASRRVSAGTAQ